MKSVRAFLVFASTVIGLSACSNGDLVSRADAPNAPILVAAPADVAPVVLRDYTVTEVDIIVPKTLKVSEANRFFPNADIVWREDPLGDRYSQVEAVITEAITQGVAGMDGTREVKVQLELTRFHALTEKTRFGAPQGSATHDIKMLLTVLDAQTGAVIEATRPFEIEFEAHTNQFALADIAQGITQRKRITEKLAQLIQSELG
ncbi:DUF6778 family protein [Aliiroseovarius subalbicans]|uniref:DUF6778 family protein n=1 Tax=Aliiroseovarius subalbicans TaxID=2925840 RepID=UPI001F565A23|nr:DUF6778 family protein [Aliiroseovarius subalbicans]MCI2398222.1 hypothetical protein [Aliiroseovarius subalbicans]